MTTTYNIPNTSNPNLFIIEEFLLLGSMERNNDLKVDSEDEIYNDKSFLDIDNPYIEMFKRGN